MIKYLLILLLLTSVINAVPNDLASEFLAVYREVLELDALGVDVSGLVSKLSLALDLMSDGAPESVSKAELIISEVRSEVSRLKSEANYYVMYRSLLKYSAIAAFALIPVATYFLLPRIYLIMWFRFRRRWVVKHGHT